MNNSTLFERLLQLTAYLGFKNLRDFSENGLHYAGSQKLYRLKHAVNKPSFELLSDLKNHFPEVDLNWVVQGHGTMTVPPACSHAERSAQAQKQHLLLRVRELEAENQAYRELLRHKDALLRDYKRLIDAL